MNTQRYEPLLRRLGEARGRQEVLDDVRMLEHGQLKTHVLAVQRCLTLARDAASVEQRDQWLDEGLSQAVLHSRAPHPDRHHAHAPRTSRP